MVQYPQYLKLLHTHPFYQIFHLNYTLNPNTVNSEHNNTPLTIRTVSSPVADPQITLPSAAFSTCLPYVAVSPNNLTASPPPQCWEDITAPRNGSAIRLRCFVLRSEILGFPLDSTGYCIKITKANFSRNTLFRFELKPLYEYWGL